MASETTELTFVRCPSCRSLVPASATRCRICNSALEGAAKHEEGDPTRNAGRVRQKTMSAGAEEVAAALAQAQNAEAGSSESGSGTSTALPAPSQAISLEGAHESADEAIDPLGAYLQELDDADGADESHAQETSASTEQVSAYEDHKNQDSNSHENSTANGHGNTASDELEKSDPFALADTNEEAPVVAKERSDSRPVWGAGKVSAEATQTTTAADTSHLTIEEAGSRSGQVVHASAQGSAEPHGEVGDGGEKVRTERGTGGFGSRRALNFGGGARQPNPERGEHRGEQKRELTASSSREQQQNREPSSRESRREQARAAEGARPAEQSRGEQGRNEQNRNDQGRSERSGDLRRARDGQQGQNQGRQQNQSRETREGRGGEQRMEQQRSNEQQRNEQGRNESGRNRGQDEQRHSSQQGRGQERTRSTKFAPGRLFGWLVSYANPDGRAIELREGKFFITQSSLKASDLVLDDESVSTPHSLMSVDGEAGLFVQDLMSERGVFVRSGEGQPYQREEGTVQLKHGDWIRFGEVEFLVSFLPGR